MAAVFAGFLLALMLRFPLEALDAAASGLRVFSQGVLPALFPYMVLCQLLTPALCRMRRIPRALPVAALAFMGGSPGGARLISLLREQGALNSRQTRLLAALTGTCSPMFLLGTVSVWASSRALGVAVLAAHWLGSVLCALCIWPFLKPESVPKSSAPAAVEPVSFAKAVQGSALAMLTVCGCIVLMSVAACLCGCAFPVFTRTAQAFLHAALEMAGGSRAIISLGFPPREAAVCVCAAISFGGVSILLQNLSFLRPVGVPAVFLCGCRALHALFSAALVYALYPLCARVIPAASLAPTAPSPLLMAALFTSLALAAALVMLFRRSGKAKGLPAK